MDTIEFITPVIPVNGLAVCGLPGIEQGMPYAVTASPIVLSSRAFAVLARGDSMVPAGIGIGHMCYCDPEQTPLPGEAVFLKCRNETGALKLFMGRGELEGFTSFKGWLEKDKNGRQKDFTIQVVDEDIEVVATVILVRRRL